MAFNGLAARLVTFIFGGINMEYKIVSKGEQAIAYLEKVSTEDFESINFFLHHGGAIDMLKKYGYEDIELKASIDVKRRMVILVGGDHEVLTIAGFLYKRFKPKEP